MPVSLQNYTPPLQPDLAETKCKIDDWNNRERPKLQRAELITQITSIALRLILPLSLLLIMYTPLWVPLGIGIPFLFVLLATHGHYTKKIEKSLPQYTALRYDEVKLKNGPDVALNEEKGDKFTLMLKEIRAEGEWVEDELPGIRDELDGKQRMLSDELMEKLSDDSINTGLHSRKRDYHPLKNLDYLDLGGPMHLQDRVRAMKLARDNSLQQQWQSVRKEVADANKALQQGNVESYQVKMELAKKHALSIGDTSNFLYAHLSIPSIREDITRVQRLFPEVRTHVSNVRTLYRKVPENVPILQKLTPMFRSIEADYQKTQPAIPLDLKGVEREIGSRFHSSFEKWYIETSPADRIGFYEANLPGNNPQLLLLKEHQDELEEAYRYAQLERILYKGRGNFEHWFFRHSPEDRIAAYTQRLVDDKKRLAALKDSVPSLGNLQNVEREIFDSFKDLSFEQLTAFKQLSLPTELERMAGEVFARFKACSFEDWYLKTQPDQRIGYYADYLPADDPQLKQLKSHQKELNSLHIERKLYQGQENFGEWFFHHSPEERLAAYNQWLIDGETRLADFKVSSKSYLESEWRKECIKFSKIENEQLEAKLQSLMGKTLVLENELNRWLKKHHSQVRLDAYKADLDKQKEITHNPIISARIEKAFSAIERIETEMASLSDPQKKQLLDRFDKEHRGPVFQAVNRNGETSLAKFMWKTISQVPLVEPAPMEVEKSHTVESSLKGRIQQLDKSLVRFNRIRRIAFEAFTNYILFSVVLIMAIFFPAYTWIAWGGLSLLAVGDLASLYMINRLKKKDESVQALKQTLQFWSVLRSHPNIPHDVMDQLQLLDQITEVLKKHDLYGISLTENFVKHYRNKGAASFPRLINTMLQNEKPTTEERESVERKERATLQQVQHQQQFLAAEIDRAKEEVAEAERRNKKDQLCQPIFIGIKKISEAIRENQPRKTFFLLNATGGFLKNLLDSGSPINRLNQNSPYFNKMIEMTESVRERGISEDSLIEFLGEMIPLLEQENPSEELNRIIDGFRRISKARGEIGQECDAIKKELIERMAVDNAKVRENQKKIAKLEELQEVEKCIKKRIELIVRKRGEG